MEDEISTFLFHLYNDENRTRDKKLYFEDVALNWKQNDILAEHTVFKTMTKYQFNKQWDLLEKERFKLRKDPDWKEPIWHEEFVRYYIKNNRDLNKALEEYEKDSKNKQIPFRKLYFLPNGYREPGAPINYFTDEF